MEFIITDRAFEFFKGMQPENKNIRLKGKVYGSTNIHDGMSVALETGVPDDPSIKAEKDGTVVYAERADEWFFEGHDLEIDFEPETQNVSFFFVKED